MEQARVQADQSAGKPALTLHRKFPVAPEKVWRAWTEPEALKGWFGPGGPQAVSVAEIDLRVGGRFRFAMTGPDGKQNTPFGGEYLEIVPNRRIVFDNGFETPGAEKMIVTVTFDEEGGKTTLTIRTLFASVAMRNEHVGGGFEQGVGSGLDRRKQSFVTL